MSSFNSSATVLTTPCTAASEAVSNPAWLVNGGYIPVILGIIVMFWGIQYICEEYCIHSITLFSQKHHFSDDILGSLFIGTGLSLPVLFVGIVGLFFSNSSIGVGAVVGGNAFNHLITIATCIYVSPNRKLILDPVTFTREIFCYLFSCFILIICIKQGNLKEALFTAFSQSEWIKCLDISWVFSFVLILGYVAYCLLTSYCDYILEYIIEQIYKFRGIKVKPRTEEGAISMIDAHHFLMRKSLTPINHHHHSYTNLNELGTPRRRKKNSYTGEVNEPEENYDIEKADDEQIDSQQIEVLPDHAKSANEGSTIRDDDEYFKGKNDPSSEDVHHELLSVGGTCASFILDHELYEYNNHIREMFTFPFELNYLQQFLFVLTFPMKILIYYTIPDVRQSKHKNKSVLSTFLGLVWLFIQSYILTEGLTLLGNLWNINSSLIGLTVAAWASNYPAHWSGVVLAAEGYGDLASCNVFGSNVFNNFLGLGLPWILYSAFYDGESYLALQDSGVVLSILLLMFIIVGHYCLVVFSEFTLTVWMIPVMLLTYVGFTAYLCYFLSTFSS